ncbi:MAG TPA: phosphate ABC transporter permease PstA, partial [Candidatus Nanoarchaeia archaeon]|nr:phosphate ABC transporter permease PstA [Candidatus Nanoarchaeia archaeon]
WKLAGVSSLASLVFVAIGHPNSDILTVAAFTAGLSGLATALQIQSRRKTENLTNMPTTTENIAKFGLVLSGIVSVTVLIGMIVYTGVRASPYLSWTFLTSTSWSWTQAAQVVGGNAPSSSMGGVMGMTIGSLFLVGFCELIAIPLGLGAAIYLSEYASQNIVTGIVRFFIETLAGIPSVIIALVGFGFFVAGTMHWGFSLFAGGLSLAFMILPWNIRIAEESMRSVPGTYREAAYALGATQWQTVRGAVLFAAFPGIITGILLGVGAALGETIVVAMTAGEPSPNFGFASHIFSIGQNIPSLPVFIWRAPLDINVRAGSASASTNVVFNTYGIALAGAFVLIIIYLAICALALVARNVLNKKIKGV